MDYLSDFLLGFLLIYFAAVVAYQYMVNGKVPILIITGIYAIGQNAISLYLGRSLQASVVWLALTLLAIAVVSFTLRRDYKNGTTIGSVDDYKKIGYTTTTTLACLLFTMFIAISLWTYRLNLLVDSSQ